MRRAAPVFAVRDLDAAMAFYRRLGFAVRRYDAGYGYAERDDLRIHLRASPEIEPFSNYAEVYVETPGGRPAARGVARNAACSPFPARSTRR